MRARILSRAAPFARRGLLLEDPVGIAPPCYPGALGASGEILPENENGPARGPSSFGRAYPYQIRGGAVGAGAGVCGLYLSRGPPRGACAPEKALPRGVPVSVAPRGGRPLLGACSAPGAGCRGPRIPQGAPYPGKQKRPRGAVVVCYPGAVSGRLLWSPRNPPRLRPTLSQLLAAFRLWLYRHNPYKSPGRRRAGLLGADPGGRLVSRKTPGRAPRVKYLPGRGPRADRCRARPPWYTWKQNGPRFPGGRGPLLLCRLAFSSPRGTARGPPPKSGISLPP